MILIFKNYQYDEKHMKKHGHLRSSKRYKKSYLEDDDVQKVIKYIMNGNYNGYK